MATQIPTQPISPSSTFPGQSSPQAQSAASAGGLPAPAGLAPGLAPGLGASRVVGSLPSGDQSNLPGAAHLAAAGRGDSTKPESEGALQLTASMARMPVALSVVVPVREFRVRSLLAMVPGSVIETSWAQGDDLPLSSANVQLAWSEFEVVDTRLAVRVTRLA